MTEMVSFSSLPVEVVGSILTQLPVKHRRRLTQTCRDCRDMVFSWENSKPKAIVSVCTLYPDPACESKPISSDDDDDDDDEFLYKLDIFDTLNGKHILFEKLTLKEVWKYLLRETDGFLVEKVCLSVEDTEKWFSYSWSELYCQHPIAATGSVLRHLAQHIMLTMVDCALEITIPLLYPFDMSIDEDDAPSFSYILSEAREFGVKRVRVFLDFDWNTRNDIVRFYNYWYRFAEFKVDVKVRRRPGISLADQADRFNTIVFHLVNHEFGSFTFTNCPANIAAQLDISIRFEASRIEEKGLFRTMGEELAYIERGYPLAKSTTTPDNLRGLTKMEPYILHWKLVEQSGAPSVMRISLEKRKERPGVGSVAAREAAIGFNPLACFLGQRMWRNDEARAKYSK